jgi:hypothetical protein
MDIKDDFRAAHPGEVYKMVLRALQDYDAAKTRLAVAKETFQRLKYTPDFLQLTPGALDQARDEYLAAKRAFETIGV